MKKRPNSIYILAALHLLAPLFTVIFSRAIKGQTLALETLFTPESIAVNWPGYLLPILAGVCIYLCKKWSMVVYLICMIALFITSYVNFSSEATSGSLTLLSLVWLINIAVVIYFLRPALRQVYTDPKIRWWEQSERFESSFMVNFKQNNQNGDGQVLNISKTGLLLKTNSQLVDEQNIELKVNLGDDKFIPLSGQVILHEHIDRGFGVKFDKSSANKKSAKQVIKSLNL